MALRRRKGRRRKGFTVRKTLLVIAVLFCTTSQAFAATVTLEVNDIGGGWAAIRYSADANVSAFGLKVTADSGAIFTDINDYNVGECTASVQGYGIFPGTIDINEDTGLVDGNGTPIAPPEDPCSHTGPTGIDTNTLILEMGALYVEPNHPDQNGTLIKVKVDKNCLVCVEGEPIRGNIVMTDGTSVEANDCGYIAMYPDCWNYSTQCWGDAVGATASDPPDGAVNTSDFYFALLPSWYKSYPDPNYNPCADGDRSGQVNTTDFMGLLHNWYKVIDPNCAGLRGVGWPCPSTDCTPGDPCGIYSGP